MEKTKLARINQRPDCFRASNLSTATSKLERHSPRRLLSSDWLRSTWTRNNANPHWLQQKTNPPWSRPQLHLPPQKETKCGSPISTLALVTRPKQKQNLVLFNQQAGFQVEGNYLPTHSSPHQSTPLNLPPVHSTLSIPRHSAPDQSPARPLPANPKF